jgi:hypothetical protein
MGVVNMLKVSTFRPMTDAYSPTEVNNTPVMDMVKKAAAEVVKTAMRTVSATKPFVDRFPVVDMTKGPYKAS